MTSVSNSNINPLNLRLPFLDGLRAICALWVMLGHARLFSYDWNAHNQVLMQPLNVLLYLHLAVVVFLTLSGYCLFLSVVQQSAGRELGLQRGALHFFKGRALRILPAYYATLLVILAINYFYPIAAWGRHPAGLTATIPLEVFLVNFTLMHDFFPHLNTINGPFWSIALEWHLYFLFPLFIFVLSRWGGFVFLAFGCAFAWGVTYIAAHPPEFVTAHNMVILNPPYFLYLFVFGIFAGWLSYGRHHYMQSKWMHTILVLLFLGFGAYFIRLLTLYPISDLKSAFAFFDQGKIVDTTFGVLTALFLVWINAQTPQHIVRRVLENTSLTKIGSYSFSLYLVHIPILAIFNHLIQLPTNLKHLHFILMVIIGGGVSLVAANYFSKVFETRKWTTIFNIHPR